MVKASTKVNTKVSTKVGVEVRKTSFRDVLKDKDLVNFKAVNKAVNEAVDKAVNDNAASVEAVNFNAIIKTVDLGKTVDTSEGQLNILKGIDLEIKKSETVAVIGASGSGKTTLLSLLAGLDVPTRGEIYLGQYKITAMDEEQRAKVRGEMVGFVFQSFQLLGSLTAIENVMLPAELKKDPEAHKKASVLLERVGLDHRTHHYPKQLSGGEQQRVAIARAFASSVEILFADEPTGNLDTKTGAHIIDLLFDLNQEFGTTLVLVTHDRRLADRCDRSIYISSGMLTASDDDMAVG